MKVSVALQNDRDAQKGVPAMKKRRLSLHHILPGFSLVFTLCVFAPADLYLSSAEEFWFTPEALVRWLLVFALTAFVLITVLAVLLPPKLSAAFRAAVYACSFLSWLQGNLLVLDYGELDGRTINWSAYTLPYVLGLLFWLAVIILFIRLMLRFRKKFRRILEIAACILLITQTLTLAWFLVQNRKEGPEESLYLSDSGQFTVSPEENTIVFVLDTVDSVFFEEVVNQYPDVIGREYADFTFYRDTVGGAARTRYAIPFMLTGDVDREERTYTDYLKAAYATSPLMNELATGRYDSGFYTFGQFMDLTRTDAIGNVASGSPAPSSRLRLTVQFMQLVAFRYLPSAFSRAFWMYSGDFERWKGRVGADAAYVVDDVSFYRDLKAQKVRATAEKPCFRFLHLRGVHSPIILDANAQQAGYGNTDETQQCLGVLKIVSDYLEQLKALGLYDRATILVMADHGSYSHSNAGQSPLFMVKLSGVSHPFETSDLPLSFASLPEILVSALQGRLTSLEPWKTSGPRYFYKRSENNATISLTEYVIDGPVWAAPAAETGVVFHEGTLNSSRAYTPGTTLYFDERDTARAYFVSGISNNEGANVWTLGNDVEMCFTFPRTPGALQLILEHGTYVTSQTVEVLVNDQLIETYTADGPTRHTILIPNGTVSGTELRLHLRLPDALSPASLGKSGDIRLLALSMKSIVFNPVDP